MAEAKDAELERVLASNAQLRQDLAALQHMRMVGCLTPLMPCPPIRLSTQKTGGILLNKGFLQLCTSVGVLLSFLEVQKHSRLFEFVLAINLSLTMLLQQCSA